MGHHGLSALKLFFYPTKNRHIQHNLEEINISRIFDCASCGQSFTQVMLKFLSSRLTIVNHEGEAIRKIGKVSENVALQIRQNLSVPLLKRRRGVQYVATRRFNGGFRLRFWETCMISFHYFLCCWDSSIC